MNELNELGVLISLNLEILKNICGLYKRNIGKNIEYNINNIKYELSKSRYKNGKITTLYDLYTDSLKALLDIDLQHNDKIQDLKTIKNIITSIYNNKILDIISDLDFKMQILILKYKI